MKLVAQDLSFSYSPGNRIFEDISFSLSKGEILAILGANGAGKTTLLNCIANLHKPDSGEIIINGADIKGMSKNEFAKVVAYVPQFHQPVFPYSVMAFCLKSK